MSYNRALSQKAIHSMTDRLAELIDGAIEADLALLKSKLANAEHNADIASRLAHEEGNRRIEAEQECIHLRKIIDIMAEHLGDREPICVCGEQISKCQGDLTFNGCPKPANVPELPRETEEQVRRLEAAAIQVMSSRNGGVH